MKILISFCNTQGYDHIIKHNISPLALWDNVSNILSWIKLPITKGFIGLTGLCKNEDRIFILSQHKKYGVLYILDKKNLNIINHQKLFKVKDPHSCVFYNRSLYIVSSGNNSVIKYILKNDRLSKPTTHYSTNRKNNNTDTVHLNSIIISSSGILISAFGSKTGNLHSTARNGYILNMSSNKKLIFPIYHPHSLYESNQKIFYCESAKSNISHNGTAIVKIKEGYTRGLILTNKTIIVGTSIPRNLSKSTGNKTNSQVHGSNTQCCRIIQIHKRHFIHDDIKIINFSKYFNEIYDLLEVNDTIQTENQSVVYENNKDIIQII